MNYLICEGKPNGDFNASSKARKDVEKILVDEKFERFFVNTKYGVQKNKIKKIFQYITYIKNKYTWDRSLNELNEKDTVIFQYPLLNTTFNFKDVIKKYSNKVTFIALIHDMDSLRYKKENASNNSLKRFKKEDKEILNNCKYIICHNDVMKKELVKLGNHEENIFTLQLFDYIIENDETNILHQKDDPIIIAGNLSTNKAGYIKYLQEIKDVKFNLYGIGYDNKEIKNVNYKGAFKPEELIEKLDGSFGLVWDGTSKKSCEGGFGNYLRYNNPHKASMYIAAGIPIAIWKHAAIAQFVEENNIGITINSLDELTEIHRNLTDKQYQEMINNLRGISSKIRRGEFLKNTLKEMKLI